MRDKAFVTITAAAAIFFCIGSPFVRMLGSSGIIDDPLKTKNLIVAEKLYDEEVPLHELLNSMETARVAIKNTYRRSYEADQAAFPFLHQWCPCHGKVRRTPIRDKH